MKISTPQVTNGVSTISVKSACISNFKGYFILLFFQSFVGGPALGSAMDPRDSDSKSIFAELPKHLISGSHLSESLDPVVTCESDQTIDLTSNCELLVPDLTDQATVVLDCPTPGLTWTQTPVAGSLLPSGHGMVHMVTVMVTDACGESSQCTVALTGNDVTPPSIVCPANTIIGCTADVPFPDLSQVIASDGCGVDSKQLQNEVISNVSCSNVYTMTRTFTAADAAGNSVQCAQIIEVKDSIGPSIVCPRNFDVNCPSNIPSPELNLVIIADDCGNVNIQKFHIRDSIINRTCANRYAVDRKFGSMDECGNMKMCSQIITVTDPLPPDARCIQGLAIELDPSGNASINSVDLNAGSTDNCGNGNLGFIASDSTFTCNQVGLLTVVLTVTDPCGQSDTCHVPVTISEKDFPELICPQNDTIQLLSGECGRIYDFTIPVATDNCNALPVIQTDTTGLTSGSFFPIGTNCLRYEVTDLAGNKASCSFCVQINEYPNPSLELACHNSVQVSLNDSCWATIGADLFLVGDVYGCFGSYQVIVRDWQFPNGPWIDRDPTRPGVQINYLDVGRLLKVTIVDPRTGNSCWGEATVEDKLPPRLTCPQDTTVLCNSSLGLDVLGYPLVYENCGVYQLDFKDSINIGACALGYERTIVRIFTAIDGFGNEGHCRQHINVLFAGLRDVRYPPHFDADSVPRPGHELALHCDQKFDALANWQQILRPTPVCVTNDWLDTSVYNRLGRRVPKALGWNCIQGGIYDGHPSPYPVYYPAHPDGSSCYGPNEVPMWIGTGVPEINGCSNFAASFTDVRLEIAPSTCDAGDVGCYKILRRWTLLDWCTGETLDTHQIINVIDPRGPEIIFPDSINVPMDAWRCEGHWDVPVPILTDNCSQELHYTVELLQGTVLGNETSGYIVTGIPAGHHVAYIVANDCCGNVSKKPVIIWVEDNTPPTPVCEQKTVITLTGGPNPALNTVTLCAETFDDGSFDNCVPHLYFKTIRMDDLQGTNNGSIQHNALSCNGGNGDDDRTIAGNQVYYDDCIQFCCDDVNKTIMVVFRVFDRNPGSGPIHPNRLNPGGDLFGRFSDCMVEVEVQNKGVPSVLAPPDVVISCSFWFDPEKIKDANDKTFGRVVTNLADRQTVKTKDVLCSAYCEPDLLSGYPGFVPGNPSYAIASNKACTYYNNQYDPNHPERLIEMVWGEDGYVLSACGSTPEISILDQRHCGPGKFLRIISARGPNGLVIRDTQTIWVVDCDPFFVNRRFACDTLDDIIWPSCDGKVVQVLGCGADISPDNPTLGRPQIRNGAKDHCNLIAIEHFDEIFIGEPNACYKILRKWVVIDWCQYEPNVNGPDKGRWEHLQLIEVDDQLKPVVQCFVGSCEPAVRDTQFGVCKAHIQLTAEATDTCTPNDWLSFEYKLDVYNDGFFDFTVGPLTRAQFNNGEKPVYDNNPLSDFKGNPFDASGIYPAGIHRIKWFVEDGCGNVGVCESVIEIKDCKAPTPVCKVGLITVPMQGSGCVDIWASDMDEGSFDNCTSPRRLKFYFAGDPDSTSMRVCCDEFIRQKRNDEVNIQVEVWVEDEEGNRDFCATTITVQDNLDVCPDQSPTLTGTIEGLVRTENGVATALTQMELHDKTGLMKSMMTGKEGAFNFYELPVPSKYELKPNRTDDAGNGVSTADIVKIQRHILGLQTLDSPYKLIAADVNKSGNITASDISEIRKLILGIQATFSKVPSWQFVPQEFVFNNPEAPWDFPVTRPLELTVDSMNQSFIAMKMGDVNNSVVANFSQSATTRSLEPVILEIENKVLDAGATYQIPVYASALEGLSGIQFTIHFDRDKMTLHGINPGLMDVGEEHFNMAYSAIGKIPFSWNGNRSLEIDKKQVLFYLNLTALDNKSLREVIALSSDITNMEAITANSKIHSVQLRMIDPVRELHEDEFELFQNTPNPVMGKMTTIYFHLPESMPVRLSLYDPSGKIQRIFELEGQKGLNNLDVDVTDLIDFGVLYYQLDAAQFTATKKMVIARKH